MNFTSSLRNFTKYLTLLLITVFITSCGSKKDIVYFQDVDQVGASKPIFDYNPIIRSDDMLTINVSALDQDAVIPFNLPAISFVEPNGEVGRATQQSYLVNAEGNIDFPVLGTLKLEGLTRIEATDKIKILLTEYIKNPIVNIRIINFKVTVLGEVNRPGTFTIQNERISILDALGLAGDMTIHAERKNVLVIREENGKKTYNRLNMTSETIFNSPLYYLRQNDIIYVEPNNSRVKSSTVGPNVTATLGVISTLAGLATVIISITR